MRNAGLFFIIATFIPLNVFRTFSLKICLTQGVKEWICYAMTFGTILTFFLNFRLAIRPVTRYLCGGGGEGGKRSANKAKVDQLTKCILYSILLNWSLVNF